MMLGGISLSITFGLPLSWIARRLRSSDPSPLGTVLARKMPIAMLSSMVHLSSGVDVATYSAGRSSGTRLTCAIQALTPSR